MNDIPPTAPSPATTANFEARFIELRQRFIERTCRDGATIRDLRARLDGGEPLSGDLLRDLCRTVHGLAGAAGVFGFEDISEAAHRAEISLRRLDAAPPDPRPLLDALDAHLAAIRDQ